MKRLRTPQEARKALEAKGVSITSWAVSNGFSPNLVNLILSGQRNPTRGQSHNIAVKLGIKAGETCTDPANALAA